MCLYVMIRHRSAFRNIRIILACSQLHHLCHRPRDSWRLIGWTVKECLEKRRSYALRRTSRAAVTIVIKCLFDVPRGGGHLVTLDNHNRNRIFHPWEDGQRVYAALGIDCHQWHFPGDRRSMHPGGGGRHLLAKRMAEHDVGDDCKSNPATRSGKDFLADSACSPSTSSTRDTC